MYQYVFGITGSWPVMEGLSQAEVGQSRPSQLTERERERRQVTPIVSVLRRTGGENLARASQGSRASGIRPRNSEAFRKIS